MQSGKYEKAEKVLMLAGHTLRVMRELQMYCITDHATTNDSQAKQEVAARIKELDNKFDRFALLVLEAYEDVANYLNDCDFTSDFDVELSELLNPETSQQ